jgi:hypothetical protein
MARFTLLVLLLGTAACTTVDRTAAIAPRTAPTAARRPAAADSARLRRSRRRCDAASLRRNPITALGRATHQSPQLGD